MILCIGENHWEIPSGFCRIDPSSKTNKTSIRLGDDGKLESIGEDGRWNNVEGVFWRTQFDIDLKQEAALLMMIRASGTPCINSPECLWNYGDRISSYRMLRESGLPVVPSSFFWGYPAYGYHHEPDFPTVMKVGNWHMGYGKIRIADRDSWGDASDMAAVTGEFVGVEPYIETIKDLRVLIFFEKVYGIERIGSQWKSNVCPKEMRIVDVPNELATMSQKAAHTMGAEIIGIDWIQNKKGEWLALEANLAPGLNFNQLDLRMEAILRLQNG